MRCITLPPEQTRRAAAEAAGAALGLSETGHCFRLASSSLAAVGIRAAQLHRQLAPRRRRGQQTQRLPSLLPRRPSHAESAG